jgi:hypothetical protein
MNFATAFARSIRSHGLRILAVAVVLGVGGGVSARAASLKEVLSPDEFRRAGLDKLTPEELAFLSERLLGTTVSPTVSTPTAAAAVSAKSPASTAPAPATAAPDLFGREHEIERQAARQPTVPNRMEAHYVGRFSGWSGRTVFTLDNGQVWQQTEGGEFVATADSPAVFVRRGAFGAYYLRIDGYGTEVKVKRLK